MKTHALDNQQLHFFEQNLIKEEKSTATVEKYLRDVRAFFVYAAENRLDNNVTKEIVIAYKQELEQKKYAVRSINSMLASINKFLGFMRWDECRVKGIRIQRQIYCKEEKELSKQEYLRLLKAAGNQLQLKLVMQTICGTGIRVSELKYFTVEAIREGEINVNCKGKVRVVLIPGQLRKLLLDYIKQKKICSGSVFVGRSGKPLDRSYIWSRMKKLCEEACVNPKKVFPHNLRKLFAKTFYKREKDIAKLADILGHGCIETTRIYIMSTGTEHRKIIEGLGLIA